MLELIESYRPDALTVLVAWVIDLAGIALIAVCCYSARWFTRKMQKNHQLQIRIRAHLLDLENMPSPSTSASRQVQSPERQTEKTVSADID